MEIQVAFYVRAKEERADKSLESSAPVELVKSTWYGKPTHEPPKGAHSLQRNGRGEEDACVWVAYVVRGVVEGNLKISRTDITRLPRRPIVDLCRSTTIRAPEKLGHFES